jgi:hypothetical protein
VSGLYADVPDHRIGYDRNGALAFFTVAGVPHAYTVVDTRRLNDEGTTRPAMPGFGSNEANGYVGILFHDLHVISAYWVVARTNGFNTRELFGLSYSTDTTNGMDGSWTTIGSGVVTADPDTYGAFNPIVPKPNFRTNIVTFSPATAKGIRFYGRGNYESAAGLSDWGLDRFHVYGVPLGPDDRLAFWDPALDALVGPAYFDWGDCAAPSEGFRTFRVKNLSPTKTARAVGLGMEALTEGSPPLVGMHTFSADGGATYGPSLALGDLAPGEISDVLTLHRGTPLGAPAGLWAQRIVASSSSFT